MSVNRLVLVLNASCEPINIVSARRAINLVLSIGIHAQHKLMIGDESAWDKYVFC